MFFMFLIFLVSDCFFNLYCFKLLIVFYFFVFNFLSLFFLLVIVLLIFEILLLSVFNFLCLLVSFLLVLFSNCCFFLNLVVFKCFFLLFILLCCRLKLCLLRYLGSLFWIVISFFLFLNSVFEFNLLFFIGMIFKCICGVFLLR